MINIENLYLTRLCGARSGSPQISIAIHHSDLAHGPHETPVVNNCTLWALPQLVHVQHYMRHRSDFGLALYGGTGASCPHSTAPRCELSEFCS